MATKKLNIVWLKRDLRTQDHLPLYQAETVDSPYVILYVFEPSILAHPDTSIRHLQFVYHSILAMNEVLKPFGREVEIFYGELEAVMRWLETNWQIDTMWSYQESGIALTWERDKWLAKHCKQAGITWIEYQRDGIIRGIKDRSGWDDNWFSVMHGVQIQNQYSRNQAPKLSHPFPIPADLLAQLTAYPASYQPAGEKMAWRYLHSFVQERGVNYHRHISKPALSRMSCSRMSPYLAWGNLSVRQVYQYARSHPQLRRHQRALSGFLSRLKWRCHFIQKFEMECEYETICINRGYESLLFDSNPELLAAWETGQTGFPLVDACMRCLEATGWINFRMRAMLVSFLCHYLGQDWRSGVYHLAQLFLDYEPGIHYPQFQMQAGTTGVHTLRMYNPIKQSEDHDPEGQFIKRWLPELSELPKANLHQPWNMNQMEESFYHVTIGQEYPAPVVNPETAGKEVRDRIWQHRQDKLVQEERIRYVLAHVRRPANKKK